MELPAISIPKVILDVIPMDQVPAIVHPPLVHFAIVLPIIIVLLELVNIIVKKGETPEEPKGKGVSTLSFLLILAMVVIFAAAYISGSVDGKAAWDTLSSDGQAHLKMHKLLGTYLVYGSLVLLVFKLLAMAMGTKFRILLLLLALLFAGVTLKQGKEGGELVYEYGANVEAYQDCSDALFDAKDELEDCKPAAVAEDSAAKEEAAAIADPKTTEGDAAAKAEVKEAASKEATEAKEATESFKTEAAADETKKVEEAAPAAEATKGDAAVKAKVEEAASEAATDAGADANKELAPEAVETH